MAKYINETALQSTVQVFTSLDQDEPTILDDVLILIDPMLDDLEHSIDVQITAAMGSISLSLTTEEAKEVIDSLQAATDAAVEQEEANKAAGAMSLSEVRTYAVRKRLSEQARMALWADSQRKRFNLSPADNANLDRIIDAASPNKICKVA